MKQHKRIDKTSGVRVAVWRKFVKALVKNGMSLVECIDLPCYAVHWLSITDVLLSSFLLL